jgi:hypothetical protein
MRQPAGELALFCFGVVVMVFMGLFKTVIDAMQVGTIIAHKLKLTHISPDKTPSKT